MQQFKLLIVALTLATATSVAHGDAGRVGVMADVGVPDGATASLVLRPISLVQLHGGVGYNLIAPGVRVGVKVQPVQWIIAPSLSLEAGHYFRGDANGAAEMFGAGGEEGSDEPVLREVGYQYANFHAGLELGTSRVTVYLHGGMSAIRGTVRNLNEQLAEGESDGEMDGPTVEVRDDPVVNLWVPSARAGVIVFF